MNYLSLENVTKTYGDKILFRDVNLQIGRGQKVALVAKNGTGKTTLLRVIAGLEGGEGENHRVFLHRDIRVGYLEQEPTFEPHWTVIETVFASDNPLIRAIQRYEWALLHPDQPEELQASLVEMDDLKAWDFEARIKEILFKLNITDLEQTVGTLSGGQVKRLALAKLLIDEPEFLILDEPTNHLDLDMVEWLEEYLDRPNLTLFIVTQVSWCQKQNAEYAEKRREHGEKSSGLQRAFLSVLRVEAPACNKARRSADVRGRAVKALLRGTGSAAAAAAAGFGRQRFGQPPGVGAVFVVGAVGAETAVAAALVQGQRGGVVLTHFQADLAEAIGPGNALQSLQQQGAQTLTASSGRDGDRIDPAAADAATAQQQRIAEHLSLAHGHDEVAALSLHVMQELAPTHAITAEHGLLQRIQGVHITDAGTPQTQSGRALGAAFGSARRAPRRCSPAAEQVCAHLLFPSTNPVPDYAPRAPMTASRRHRDGRLPSPQALCMAASRLLRVRRFRTT